MFRTLKPCLCAATVMLAALSACGPKTSQEKIIGQWTMDRVEVNIADNDNSDDTYKARTQIAMLEAMLKGATVEYFHDMTYERTQMNQSESGTYQFINDRKYLEITFKDRYGETKTEKFKVQTLTDEDLKLEVNEMVTLVFRRPNKQD